MPRLGSWWSAVDLRRRGAGLSRLSSCRFCVCFNTDDERLPRVRIPIRFRGVSRASTLWAYLWARIRSGGRWRYSLRKASRFFQLKTIKKLPRPSALIFTSAAPHPTRKAHCSALGLVAGFRPPRPRLSGESRKKNYMRLAGSSRPGRA